MIFTPIKNSKLNVGRTISLSTKTNFYFAKTRAFISFVSEEIKNAYHLFWDEN